jgi:hypothetical protein
MKKELWILHFQPIENYPPVMNVLHSMVNSGFKIVVLTTRCDKTPFFCENVKIIRFGDYSINRIYRYLCYFNFNIIGSFFMILKNARVILFYESFSVIPVYFINVFRPEAKLLMHYHEFELIQQDHLKTFYNEILIFLEKKVISKTIWLSHTNNDRLNNYICQNAQVKILNPKIFPNFPSNSWTNQTVDKNLSRAGSKLKIVYVGSLGFETTFILDFLGWLFVNKDYCELTIYPQSMDKGLIEIIQSLNYSNLYIENNISYYDLPGKLIEFQVGLVLYTGHSPNYVYNVPNKVNEYLACGLNVWYSDVLISTHKFAEENPKYPLYSVDFSKGKNFKAPEFSSEPFEFKHWHEDAVKPLIDSIKHAMDSSLNTF